MTEQNFLSSNFEDLIRSAVRPADPAPETLERILAEVKRNSGRKTPPRLAAPRRTIIWAAASAIVLALVIVVLLVSPQKVMAEIRRIFEVFVPGYGFVQDEDSLRMILKPVRLERNGSWDTIEQAFTDSTQTVIIPGSRFYAGSENFEGCVNLDHHEPYILMIGPSGEEIRLNPVSVLRKMVFPPIPTEIKDVTLVMEWAWPCNDEADWEFPLHFDAAPPGTVIPVIAVEEIAPTMAPTPESNASEAAPQAPAAPVLSLKKVIETANGYIFGGTLTWEENPEYQQRYDMPMADALSLVDAGQISYVVENTNPYDLQMSETEPRENELNWAYLVNGKNLANPLTLTIPSLIKFVDDPSRSLAFDLDFGANPQSGLAWSADRQFEMDGKKFKLIKLEYRIDPNYPDYREVRYSFMVDPGFRSIFISPFCPEETPDPGSMGGGGGNSGTIEVVDDLLIGYTSFDRPPTGVCTFTISGIEYDDRNPVQIIIPLPGK